MNLLSRPQTDLCEMGSGCIPEDLARNFRNVEKVSGPAVWQIQRIRNTAAPKADPDNDHGNKFLRQGPLHSEL